MAVGINRISPIKYPEGKEKAVLQYVDLLIVILPSFEKFDIHKYIKELGVDKTQESKIFNLINEIQETLLELKYIKPVPDENRFQLTPLGRQVKEKGGYFNYKKLKEDDNNKDQELRNLKIKVHKLQVKRYWRDFLFFFIGLLPLIIDNWEKIHSFFQ